MLLRPFWIMLGIGAVVAGVIGIVLPLVPTTPFLLLAAFAFARGSPVLHKWLLQHPLLGQIIEDWQRDGAIEHRARNAAIIVMVVGLLISLWLEVPNWVLLLQLLIFTAVGVFLATRPAPRRDLI